MNKICQSSSMQPIYAYQEYRITMVYDKWFPPTS